MSIVTRIFLLIAVTLLLVAGGELFNGINLRQQRLAEVRRDTVQLARIAELDIARILDGAHQLLATLANLPLGHGWDDRACAIVEATASGDFEYDHINAVGRNGTIECSSSGAARIGEPIVDRELFHRIVATHEFAVGSYGRGQISGNEVLRVGHPVDGAGAVYAGINLTWLNTALSQWKIGEQTDIIITDRNNVVIARYPDSRGVGQPIADILKPFLSALEYGAADVTEAGGAVRLYGYIPIALGPSDSLGVFVGRDREQVFADINRSIWLNGTVGLVGLLLSALISMIFVRRFLSRPFQSLLTVAARWRDGDWSARTGTTSGIPEFDRLATTFDDMAAAVNDRDTLMRRRDALLHSVVISAAEVMTARRLEESIPRALEMVGRTILVDRITVLDRPPTPDVAPVLKFVWQSPDLMFILDNRFFENAALVTPEIAAWQAPLSEGKIAKADMRTAVDDLRNMLESLGTKSLLVLPVSIEGEYWGNIGFESCKTERDWLAFETEDLQLLANLIGNAIERERYVEEIANANKIVEHTPTVLYRLRGEPSLPLFYVSQNIKQFGYDPAALIASPALYQGMIHPDDRAAVGELMAHMLDRDFQRGTIEYRLLTGHGDYRWVENRYTPIRDGAGRLTEIEGLLYDITERKAAEAKISLLARTDPLTGLPNRTTFIDRLQQSFAAARRGATGFSVLYLDIDRFKDINDTLGHPAGDRLLITVGERLQSSVRGSDMVSRLGGDEFAVLQSDLSDTADAGTLATKIRAALAEPVQIAGSEVHITASIGIAIYAQGTVAPEDMLAQADVALYRAKEEGRDQYRFHTEEVDVQVRDQIEITDELRMALSRDEFELRYQPQVALSTGRIVGMEALIRWHHPQRGLLMPSAFIAVAERTGSILAIGQWVLEHACQQMSSWRASGIAPQTITVNISPVQIKAGDEFAAFVTETLAKWHLAPSDLELDVTETMLARLALMQNNVLERLQKIGVKISIDDFGTKYSSLDYLKTYNVNRIKIPQRLTDSTGQDPLSTAMARAIVGIARELNIEVVAQGVETEAQWSHLTVRSPVTTVQGFFYSEPVLADRAEELLRRGRIAPPADGHASRPVDSAA